MDLKGLIFGGSNVKSNSGTKSNKNVMEEGKEESKIEPKSSLLPTSKKIKKSKKKHTLENAKIKYIGFPMKLVPNERCRRRFSCEVVYQDLQGKSHKKHVRFGNVGKSEYIDHHDDMKRLNTVSKLANTDDPLQSNFYRMYLLNSKNDNITDAYFNLVQSLKLT